MENKKQVLQGIDNFKKLIDSNGYYIDKTQLIKDLIETPDQIVLVTRPRRFGKTLNMSMLKYFFEIPECRKHDQEDVAVGYLFEGLKIFEEEKYRYIQGTEPVVYMTFKNAKQDNWENAYENMKRIIANEYKRHSYILEKELFSETEKEEYKRVMELKASQVEYTDVIINLCEYLKRYYKKQCRVIIDEYDTPIQAGYINGYFKEIIEFQKSMLVKGFKDNLALKQGVLTGIMKVAQESIFSDFNNPMVATVISEKFKERFGFTEAEVEEMAKYYKLEDKLEELKEWYNGYIFGLDTVIYNPWSIIKYMSSPIEGFRPYWINTSDNRIIKQVMQLDKKDGKEVVEKPIKGEEVRKVIEENVVYQSIEDNTDVAWSFLLHAGYLKAHDRRKKENRYEYRLEIPNLEVQTIYEEMIINYFKEDAKVADDIKHMIQSLMDRDMDMFEIMLSELYMKEVSVNDVGVSEQKTRHENFYHGFILGLLMFARDNYEIYSNREYGLGRPDIVMVPKMKKNTAYIFEFKWESTKGAKKLETLLEMATNQINENKYKEGVRSVHDIEDIVCIAVGFKGKEIKMFSDVG